MRSSFLSSPTIHGTNRADVIGAASRARALAFFVLAPNDRRLPVFAANDEAMTEPVVLQRSSGPRRTDAGRSSLALPAPRRDGAMLEPTTIPHPMDEIRRAADAYLAGHPIDDPLVSPRHGDLTGLPPLLVQSAPGDRARPEAEALARGAAEHGLPVRLEIFAAESHVFHVFASFLPEARDALAQAGEFVRDALAVDPASANHAG